MLDEKNLLNIALSYFDAWNQHDIHQLDLLMAQYIELTDWDIACVGKSETLAANEEIFSHNPGINAEIIELTTGRNKVYAELVIKTAGETLKVLDVISIDSSTRLIFKIEAYRQ